MAKDLIILCGIPNSGKSTLAEKAKKYMGYHIISRDQIRIDLSGGKYVFDPKMENEVTRVFLFWFKEYVKNGYNIILDNCHTKEAYIDEYIKRKPDDYKIEVVFFDIPLWKAYYRNVKRWILTGKFIPFSVIKNMWINYNKIDKSKYENIHNR